MKLGLAILVALTIAGYAGAVEPSFVDALLSSDATVREKAQGSLLSLPEPDKVNLATTLAGQIEDPTHGEFAAMALCRMGDAGVPWLERHARTPYAGSEFAAMGLLAGPESGNDAAAAILRDGDADAVMRMLAVVEASTLLPASVETEVKNLSVGNDQRFAVAARAALEEVEAAKKKPAKSMDEATLMKMLEKMSADAEKAASASSPTKEEPKGWSPDGSQFKTRQPATESFGKNRSQ